MTTSTILDTTSLRADARVISVVGLAHATSHFLQLLLPPLFPWIIADFHLSYTKVGALMTALFVTSGLGQAAAGFVVDRIGAWRVLAGGVGLCAVAAFLISSAQGYAGLLAGALVAGLANAGFHPADFTLLNRHVSQPRLSHAFSVHGLAGYSGYAIAPVTLAAVAAWSGWRTAAALAGGVAVVALAVVLASRSRLVDGAAPASHGQTAEPRTGSSPFGFLRVATVWVCFLYFLLATTAMSALQNFAPSVLHRTHGLTLAAATASLSLFLLGAAAGIAAGGALAARSDAHDRRIAVSLGVAALTAVGLAVGLLPGAAAAPAMTLIGFCTGVAVPSRDLLVRRAALSRFGPGSFGRIYGFVYSAVDVGSAIAPIVFGRLLDHGRFGAVLGGVAILQVLAVATVLNVRRAARSTRRDGDLASASPQRPAEELGRR